MTDYKFTGNIVENNMDYSYFQFTNDYLLSRGLKIVIAFIHKEFTYEVWLSGMNRKVQEKYHVLLNSKKHPYILSPNPNKYDYIIKESLVKDIDYEDCDKLFISIKDNAIKFNNNIDKLLS
jgi:hypothetical protein